MLGSQIKFIVITTYECKYHIVFSPKLSVSSFMGYLKGRGFYVSTVGNNKSSVYNYVENQLKEDMVSDKLTIKEYKDFSFFI